MIYIYKSKLYHLCFVEMLKRALASNWQMLLEAIGLWLPADVVHTEHNDKPENEQDLGNSVHQLESSTVLFHLYVIFNSLTS